MRILSFKLPYQHVAPLYSKLNVLKVKDHVFLNNCLFVYDCLNNKVPQVFLDYCNTTLQQHQHNTRGVNRQTIILPQVNTKCYGRESFIFQSSLNWYSLSTNLGINTQTLSRTQLLLKTKLWLLNQY